MLVTQKLQPNAIAEISNFSPNDVTYLQDSPESIDANNLVTLDGTYQSYVDLTFDFSGELNGTQNINLVFTDPNWVGIFIKVLENDVEKHVSEIAYTGYDNLITSFSFDSGVLDNPTSENIVIRVIGNVYNGLRITHLSSVELEATYDYPLKTDWSPEDSYNHEELNRVETATKIVADKLAEFRTATISLNLVENRTESHIEFADSFNRIEGNIAVLVQTLNNPLLEFDVMKTDWVFNTPFDFNDANRLERNLGLIYNYVVANQANIPYCGQYTVGQEGVF